MSRPRVTATMRQIEALIARLRDHREHARVNPVYREALETLRIEVGHAVNRGGAPRQATDLPPPHVPAYWPTVGPNGELPSSWTPSDRLVGIEYDVFMGDGQLADRLDRLERFIGLPDDARGES